MFQQPATKTNARSEWHGNMAVHAAVQWFVTSTWGVLEERCGGSPANGPTNADAERPAPSPSSGIHFLSASCIRI